MGLCAIRRPAIAALAAGILIALLAACAPDDSSREACVNEDRELKLGFYAYFSPISYSADGNAGSAGFDVHLGYEADLLYALEAMEGAGLSFARRGIGPWDDIWLAPASPEFDMVGGGITILDARTRDSEGREAVTFTGGHVAFRQSVLVRSADKDRFASYDDLTGDVRIGALADTTGEARLLQITGLTDADGVLAADAIVSTPNGAVVADGSDSYVITSADESDILDGRRHIQPPSSDMPQVVYLGDELGEAELLAALSDGAIDGLARGEIGNLDAGRASGDEFAIALLDDEVELGGFSLAIEDAELASCISDKLDYLTDDGNIGYAQWARDPAVFMQRAATWNEK